MTTQTTLPETDLIGGHDADSVAPQAPVAEPPKPVAEQPKPTFTPVYVGGRRFDSAEALAQYTSELEQSRAQQTRSAPAPEVDPEKELADLMFEDPTAYTKLVQERAYQRFVKETQTQQAQVNAWQTFYGANKDLVGYEDLVEVSRAKIGDKLKNLPLEEASKVLGNAVRERLSQIKGSPQGMGTELPSGPAVASGTSNGPGVKPPVQQQQPKSLIEQINELRASKKTRR